VSFLTNRVRASSDAGATAVVLQGAFRNGAFRLAADLLEKMMTGVEFPEFLTLAAYNYLD